MIQITTAPTFETFSLEAWYREHFRAVLKICLRYAHDRMLAEDLTQEIFCKLHDSHAGFTGQSQPSTWIHRVAVNHCIDYLRRKRRQRDLMTQFFEVEDAVYVSGNEEEESPAIDLLRKCLEKFDPAWKQVVFLRYEVGLTHGQIAEICGISRVAITRRLGRLQRRLEQQLKQQLSGSATAA